jgi:hypothetical protein
MHVCPLQTLNEQYENPKLPNGYLHQLPDHPNSKIKARALAWIAANDERSRVLNPRVIWNGIFDQFEIF